MVKSGIVTGLFADFLDYGCIHDLCSAYTVKKSGIYPIFYSEYAKRKNHNNNNKIMIIIIHLKKYPLITS